MKYIGWISIEGSKKNHFTDMTLYENECTLCGYYFDKKITSEPILSNQSCKKCTSSLDFNYKEDLK